jgi:glycosyltransferase involved in cell wall biosynthesis
LNSNFRFKLYCDDGSFEYQEFVQRFRLLGVDVITHPLVDNYREFLRSLDDVQVGLAPLVDMDGFSAGKSFGKVLAYMDRGVPIVTHPVVDHPLFFENGVNAYLSECPNEWARIIAKLLNDAGERQRLADAARADLQARLSTGEAARRVGAILDSVLGDLDSTSGT